MEKLTRDNFQQQLQAQRFQVSKCGVCGLPKWKCWRQPHNNKVLEIRPTQTQFGSFVIIQNNSPVVSGYLYELTTTIIEKHFPPADVPPATR